MLLCPENVMPAPKCSAFNADVLGAEKSPNHSLSMQHISLLIEECASKWEEGIPLRFLFFFSLAMEVQGLHDNWLNCINQHSVIRPS